MNIREDFKFEPESWDIQAKNLMKRSISVLIILSTILPLAIYYLTSILSQIINANIGENFTSALLISLVETSPLFLLYASFFYVVFFYKRVDFNQKINLISMISDIKNTFGSYVQVLKENKSQIVFLSIIMFSCVFVGSLSLINIGKMEESLMNVTLLKGIIYSFGWFGLSIFFALSVFKESIFGVVYIGYKMVNFEGAKILTRQAYSKYPELQKYMYEKIGKVNMFLWISIFSKLFIFSIIKDNNMGMSIVILINCAFTVYCLYSSAVIYLISRDLYGGSPKKLKEEVKIENENMIPQI